MTSYRFFCWPFFEKNVGWCSILIQPNFKRKQYFLWLLSGPSKGYYLVQVWGTKKKANWDQIITIEISARNFVQKMCWNPYFVVFCDKQCLETNTLDQTITITKQNLDQIITPQLYVYIYISLRFRNNYHSDTHTSPTCTTLIRCAFPKEETTFKTSDVWDPFACIYF